MKTQTAFFNIAVLSLLLAACKETAVVNEFPDLGLIITSINPETGGPGMTVEIEGLGFSSTAEENTVTFDGLEATVDGASTNRILTTVPEGVNTGPVQVQVAEETARGPVFTLDGRLVFVGEYMTQDFEMRWTENEFGNITEDTTFTIDSSYRIDIELSESSANHIEVDIKEFVDQSFRTSFSAIFGSESSGVLFVFRDQTVARVNGGNFKLSTTNFDLSNGTVSLLGEFFGGGALMEDETILLSFIYKIVGEGVELSLSGEVILERQE